MDIGETQSPLFRKDHGNRSGIIKTIEKCVKEVCNEYRLHDDIAIENTHDEICMTSDREDTAYRSLIRKCKQNGIGADIMDHRVTVTPYGNQTLIRVMLQSR